MQTLDDVTGAIIDAAIDIHRDMGPSLFEHVYEILLASRLRRRGLDVERQVAIPIEYDGMRFHEGFRADLVVADRVIVELKSIERVAPVHKKQVLTYLRLARKPVGLLMNFGQATLREGLYRIVNDLDPRDSPTLGLNRQHPQ